MGVLAWKAIQPPRAPEARGDQQPENAADRVDRLTARILAFLPVFDEEDHIGPLLKKFEPVLAAGGVHELLAVDDGSTDRTPDVLARYEH